MSSNFFHCLDNLDALSHHLNCALTYVAQKVRGLRGNKIPESLRAVCYGGQISLIGVLSGGSGEVSTAQF